MLKKKPWSDRIFYRILIGIRVEHRSWYEINKCLRPSFIRIQIHLSAPKFQICISPLPLSSLLNPRAPAQIRSFGPGTRAFAMACMTVQEFRLGCIAVGEESIKNRKVAKVTAQQLSNNCSVFNSEYEDLKFTAEEWESIMNYFYKPDTGSDLEDFEDAGSDEGGDTNQLMCDGKPISWYYQNVIGMQVFSVKVTEIRGVKLDENADVYIYGNVIARDSLDDFARNNLFRRDFDNRIRLGSEGTVPLFGPRRCLISFGSVQYDFNLYVVCNGEPKGKRLVKGGVDFDCPVGDEGLDRLLCETVKGPNGTIEIIYAAITGSFQATVEVKHRFGEQSGLRGKIVAFLGFDKDRELSKQEIVLFDSDLMNEDISFHHQGLVKLWCPVLSVTKETGMRLEFHLKSPKVTCKLYSTRVASFHRNFPRDRFLDFGFVGFSARLSWHSPPPACKSA